jgi:hypothetical protein
MVSTGNRLPAIWALVLASIVALAVLVMVGAAALDNGARTGRLRRKSSAVPGLL